MIGDPVIEASGVSKKYGNQTRASMRYGVTDLLRAVAGRPNSDTELRAAEHWAIRSIDFEVGRGEAVGLIGANGAGKSTLLRILDGISEPTEGHVVRNGTVASVLDLGSGLNEILSGRENLRAKALLHGIDAADLAGLEDEIVEFADIGAFIDAPVRAYSQGMRMRLAYAVIASVQADVLLIDEALSVGDMAFRLKCRNHIDDHLRRGGALVFVSHSVWMVQNICDRVVVLEAGEVVFEGDAAAGVAHYLEALSLPESMTEWTDDHVIEAAHLPVEITSVTISANDGGPPRFGELAIVSIDFRASELPATTVWAQVICTGDGNAMLAGDISGPVVSEGLAHPHGRVTSEIREFPLVDGSYSLRIAVFEHGTMVMVGSHGFTDPPTHFVSEGGERDRTLEAATGPVNTELEVTFDPNGPPSLQSPTAG